MCRILSPRITGTGQIHIYHKLIQTKEVQGKVHIKISNKNKDYVLFYAILTFVAPLDSAIGKPIHSSVEIAPNTLKSHVM